MNDMVLAKLKEIINFQDIIKINELNYKSKRTKVYNFNEYFWPIVLAYMKDIYHKKILMKSKATLLLN